MLNTSFIFLTLSSISNSPHVMLPFRSSRLYFSVKSSRFSYFTTSLIHTFNHNYKTEIKDCKFMKFISTPLIFESLDVCHYSANTTYSKSMPIKKIVMDYNFVMSGINNVDEQHVRFISYDKCGDINIYSCTFQDLSTGGNSEKKDGGGLCVEQGGCKVTLHTCYFFNCRSQGRGGGSSIVGTRNNKEGDDTPIELLKAEYCCFSQCANYGTEADRYGVNMYVAAKDTTLKYTSTLKNNQYTVYGSPDLKSVTALGALFDLQAKDNLVSSNVNSTGGSAKYCAGMEYRKASKGSFQYQTYVGLTGKFITSFTSLSGAVEISYCNYIDNTMNNENDANDQKAIISIRERTVIMKYFSIFGTKRVDDTDWAVAREYCYDENNKNYCRDHVFPRMENCIFDIEYQYNLFPDIDVLNNNNNNIFESRDTILQSISQLNLYECVGEKEPEGISQTFTPSTLFSNSEYFSRSKQFSESEYFSKSELFSQSSKFSFSSMFSSSEAFSNSVNFSSSTGFTGSEKFSFSNQFTKSSLFSQSENFTFSSQFSSSSGFSYSSHFTGSDAFSLTHKFSDSEDFSESPHFSKSANFTFSSMFSGSSGFSSSSGFSNSAKFTGSKAFLPTGIFTDSGDFSKSSRFSDTAEFTFSNHFSGSTDFSDSLKFSNSEHFSESSHFSDSNDFSFSSQFSCTSNFSSSSGFSNSEKFTRSDAFQPTKNFTDSRRFSASTGFTRSSKFSGSDSFSTSDSFTKSSHFSNSNDFTLSFSFTASDDPNRTKIFTPSTQFTLSHNFSSSLKFTKSDGFSGSSHFSNTGHFTGSHDFSGSSQFHYSELPPTEMPINIVVRDESNSSNKISPAQIGGIVAAAAALAAILTILVVFINRKKKYDIFSADISEQEAHNEEEKIHYDNPIYNNKDNIDDPFSEDFSEFENFLL